MALFRRDTDHNDDHDGERPFWAKPGFLFTAVVVVAVILLGVILAFTAGGDDEPAAAQQEPPGAASDSPQPEDSTRTTSAPPVSGGDSVSAVEECPDLSGRGGADALTVGPEVQWSPVGEVAAAYSEENGPAVSDGINQCYAHTPSGALLAAYGFLADFRTWSYEPSEVVEARVMPGSQAYAFGLDAATQEATYRAGGGQRETLTVQGYRFLESTSENNTIAFIHTLNRPSDVVYTQDEVTVEWTGTDWMVTKLGDIESVSELPAGYVSWGPEQGNPE